MWPGSIQDSFNHAQQASDKDLRINLESLCKQVEQLSQTMPRDVADQVTQDLSTFVMEVTKEQPRRKWYELSAEGLIEAAKSCAGMASPGHYNCERHTKSIDIKSQQVTTADGKGRRR